MHARLMMGSAVTVVALVHGAGSMSRGVDLPQVPFTLGAFAINMTNVNLPRGNAGMIQIRIAGWSADATRQRLISTMLDKGQNALLSALQKEPDQGRISIPGWQGADPQNYRLGWTLRYTARDPLPDGGERIVIATDRQMSMWEVRNRPRTFDYPFTLIEIHMPSSGKGEGRMFGATQIRFDKRKNEIVLEQYAAGEIRLNEIEILK